MTQQGQTDDFTASRHIQTLSQYLGFFPDYCLINTKIPSKPKRKAYEKEHAFMVRVDKNKIAKLPTKPVFKDLLQKNTNKQNVPDRREYLRHDAEKVAQAVISLL